MNDIILFNIVQHKIQMHLTHLVTPLTVKHRENLIRSQFQIKGT